jgi:DNA-binding FadR family transcriptional regulator
MPADEGVTRPARTGRLGDRATEQIGRRIVSGQLRPGEQLPTEAVLCGELGMSRTTVREAVKRLHGKGLLDGGPRTGMRVLPTARWNQLDRDVLSWRAENGWDADLTEQLYAVRGCMEPEACRIAAGQAGDAERQRIVGLFDAMAAGGGDPAGHVEADVAFHLAIFAATGNPFFVTLGEAIRTALELAFQQSQRRRRMTPGELGLHGEVARAIARGRPDGAARAMRRLLALSREALLE